MDLLSGEEVCEHSRYESLPLDSFSQNSQQQDEDFDFDDDDEEVLDFLPLT
jgi:hypothetical protein